MSPDLERLLNALWERDSSEPQDRARWNATVERFLGDACVRRPRLSREHLIDALAPRYREFRRTRRKPSFMPPKA